MSQSENMLRIWRGPIVENYRRTAALVALFTPTDQRTPEDKVRMRYLSKCRRRVPAPKDMAGAEVLAGHDGEITFLLPDGRTVAMTVFGYDAEIEWEEQLA